MAGSYRHVITNQGNLASPERVNGMLENGGDVYEAVEEMYGMIWWLATMLPGTGPSPPEKLVEQAHQEYKVGLKLARGNKNKRGLDGS